MGPPPSGWRSSEVVIFMEHNMGETGDYAWVAYDDDEEVSLGMSFDKQTGMCVIEQDGGAEMAISDPHKVRSIAYFLLEIADYMVRAKPGFECTEENKRRYAKSFECTEENKRRYAESFARTLVHVIGKQEVRKVLLMPDDTAEDYEAIEARLDEILKPMGYSDGYDTFQDRVFEITFQCEFDRDDLAALETLIEGRGWAWKEFLPKLAA